MKKHLGVLLAILAAGATAPAQSIRANAGFKAQSVPRNDDGSSALTPLGFTINFFGKTRDSAYVNNNGNLTFDSALPTFTPFGLQQTAREIIAPFFADVDTRPAGSNLVTFGPDTVNGHNAFGANYVSVGYYNVHADKLNSFQVVLIDRTDTGTGNFDIEFNYATITWETGDASGGVNGYGGTPAVVGWSNGTSDPTASYQLPGSLVSGAFLDGGPHALARQTVNSTVSSGSTASPAGRLIYRARDGVISPGLSIGNSILPDATVGKSYTAALTATGAKPPFRWTLLPDVNAPPGLTLSQDGTLSGVPTQEGMYSFTLGVTATTEDGDLTAYQRGSITIQPATISIISACPLNDGAVGRPYSVNLSATGSPSGYLWNVDDRYSLPPGVGLSENGLLAGIPLSPGTYIFNLNARPAGTSAVRPAQLLCHLTIAPAAVSLSSGCLMPNGTVGVPYAQVLTADGGYAPYRFQLLGQLPLGLSLTADGFLSGMPQLSETLPFQISAIDSRGVRTLQSCSLTVDAPAFNLTSACPLPAGITGSPYTAKLPGNYTWSLSGALPAGITMSPEGSLSGTPMAAGAAKFLLLAADTFGHQAGQVCSLTVTRGALSIGTCPLPDASVGEPYQTTVSVLGGSAPYFVTASTLPDGVTLTGAGLASGTAKAAGSYPFSLSVRDSAGQTFTQACSMNVKAPVLRITTSCPLPAARLGQSYSARITAAGGTSPYRFDFLGFLPDGLQGSNNGSLSGTPAALGGGSFGLRVTDGANQTALAACSVDVTLPESPNLRIGDLPATVAPATSSLSVVVQLDQPYPQAVQGQVALAVQSDARSLEGAANVADPRLRFTNGQAVANFTIAPGARSATLPLATTGTVASTVTVALQSLRAAGADLPIDVSPAIFRIPAGIPVLTSACYTRTATGINIEISGYSTTRELTRLDVVTGADSFRTDISGAASDFFSGPLTVRSGGTFALTLPYNLSVAAKVPLSSVNLNLFNAMGGTGTRSINACQ